MPRWTFFLGGHDLEMIEIARLLGDRDDVTVIDRGGGWDIGASAYLKELAAASGAGSQLVLVELRDDLPADFPRDRLKWIDHHGPMSGAARTSIEQIFELLSFPKDRWTRDLELVAANDRGHIEALVKAGATQDEIRTIRRRDRQAQGITPEQEQQGRDACRSRLRACAGRLTIVELPHSRAATVTDVLDPRLGGSGYENLLIFSPDETQIFGCGRIVGGLAEEYPESWTGGELPRRGYWGIQKKLPAATLIPLVESLLSLPAAEIPIRIFRHILLWPMLLRGPRPDEKTGAEPISPWIEALEQAGWKEPSRGSLDVCGHYKYAEIVYFHPFVRDFLFGDGKTKTEDRVLRRFVRQDVTSVSAAFSAATKENPKPLDLELQVDRVELFLIRPRVAILLVEVSKPAEALWSLEQVLILQSRFHQIYPPFFRDEGGEHGECLAKVEWKTLKTREDYTTASPRKDFEDFVRAGSEPPIYAHWWAFLGDRIRPLASAEQLVRDPEGLYVQQLLDNRMPGLSFIGVDDPRAIHPDDLDRLPSFDPPGLDYDPAFRETRRERFRYTRFSHWRTTYYGDGTSMTLVTEDSDFAREHLLNHFRRHYTHLALIAQYQHAALLHFADELADTAKELANRSDGKEFDNKRWKQRIRRLQSRFLKFRTRSYFTEVSNQIQGKDLFRFWLDHLGTEALFDRVAQTNAEVYAALENHETMMLTRTQTKLSRAQTSLSKVATVGLILSILLAVFSLSADLFGLGAMPAERWPWYFALALGLSGILIGIFNWRLTGDPRTPPVEWTKPRNSKPGVTTSAGSVTPPNFSRPNSNEE